VTARTVALLFLAAAGHPAQEGVTRPLTAPPDRRIELDFQHYYTPQELGAALRQLAEAYPEFLSLESLAVTRGLNEVLVLTASDTRGVPAAQRPGVLVVGSLGQADLQGAEMALYSVFELVQNHGRDPDIARRLQESVLYFVPCLDPDLRQRAFLALEGGEVWTPPSVRLDRNFPVGWRPNTGGGPYPLSEVETRALVEFLMAHQNIAVVQVYGAAREAEKRAEPAADAAAYAVLCAQAGEAAARGERQPLHSVLTCGAGGGGLLEFASAQLGAFAFCVEAGRGAAGDADFGMPRPGELTVIGQRAARTTLALVDALPRLELSAPSVQRLKNDQWQVELAVTNVGRLSSLSRLESARGAVPPPRLRVEGVELVAAMLSERAGTSFRAVDHAEGAMPLAELGPGAQLSVRLVVTGAPGSALTLELLAPRAGLDWAQVRLE
jgi:hypothetical protein